MSTILTLALLPLLTPGPIEVQDPVRYGRVSVEDCRLHSYYDDKTASVGEFEKGMPVRVVGETVPWLQVEVPGGLDLWIHVDYVSFVGAIGHSTNDRVRARPIPSTGSSSHPLGHFKKAEDLVRVGAAEDWVQVRSPERLAGWLKADQVTLVSVKPKNWDADWASWAKRRAPTPVVPKVEGTGESEAPAVVVPPGESIDVPIGEPDAAGPVVAGAAAAQEASATTAPTPEDLLPTPAEIATDPAAAVDQIEEQLNVIYRQMVADREYWDREMLDALEFSIGHLLWNAEEDELLNRGRRGLRRIDVLRRSYLDALGRQVRAAETRNDDEVAVLLRRRLNLATAPVPAQGDVLVVGVVEYEAGPHEGRPFRVERLGYRASVHSFDGRYSLKDYRAREVVLLGTWRDEPSKEGGESLRVLDIRQLRVMPKLKSER